ncbi:MAG: asparagine synthase family protein [Candidatus Helarchaeota archaeon]
MAGIIGLYLKKKISISDDIKSIFINMFRTLRHRGNIFYVYNGETFVKFHSLDKISLKDLNIEYLIGYNTYKSCDFLETNYKFPKVASDGIYFTNELNLDLQNEKDRSISQAIYNFIKTHRSLDIINILKKLIEVSNYSIQEFSSVVIDKNNMFLIKDPLGIHPLFMCETKDFIAFGSERKCFWNNNIFNNIERIKPGSIIQMTGNRKLEIFSKTLTEIIKFGNITPDSIIDKIKSNIINSIKRRIKTSNSMGLLYSGGLDSSLLQYYLRKMGIKSKSILMGMKGSTDLNQDEVIKKDLIRIKIKIDDLFKRLMKLLYMIERPDFLTLEIAFLFQNAAIIAKKDNINAIIAGQGADELFAGYNKYQRLLKNDYTSYKNQLNHDLNNLSLQNLEASEMVLSSYDIHLLLPYLDIELIKIIRKVEPRFLIQLETGRDKLILRKIASDESLTDRIINKKKHALQYSTRIHHVFDKFIRDLGFNKIFSQELGYSNNYRELFLDYLSYLLNFPSKLNQIKIEKINKNIKVKY